MQVSCLLQRHDDPVAPGISRDQEDDHEDEKHPGADSVDLDKDSAGVQRAFTTKASTFYNIIVRFSKLWVPGNRVRGFDEQLTAHIHPPFEPWYSGQEPSNKRGERLKTALSVTS